MVAQLRACSAKSRAASVGAVEFWPGPFKSLLCICTFTALVSCVESSRSFGFCSVDASLASSDFSWSTVEYS